MKPLPSDIWRLGTALTPVEKLVALALADYGDRIYPSQGALAIKTGLHASTINRVVASLRTKGLVSTTGSGKALSYRLNLSQKSRGTSAPAPEHLSQKSRGALAEKQRDPNEPNELAQEPAAADAARGEGWAVFEPIRSRILQRDPRADFGAQAKVCRRILAQHGLTLPEAERAWHDLCGSWARTGVSAYEALNRLTLNMADVRNPRAVLLHRLKEVA